MKGMKLVTTVESNKPKFKDVQIWSSNMTFLRLCVLSCKLVIYIYLTGQLSYFIILKVQTYKQISLLLMISLSLHVLLSLHVNSSPQMTCSKEFSYHWLNLYHISLG